MLPVPSLSRVTRRGRPVRQEIPLPGSPHEFFAGGREHLLVLASPDRLVEFEAGLSGLPRPGPGGLAVAIPEGVKIHLRGIGTLGDGGPQGGASSAAGHLFDLAERLAGPSENAAGAWLRRIDLDNPER